MDRIINRLGPCKCGCRGTDSQHARYFDRTIRKKAPANREVKVIAHGDNGPRFVFTVEAEGEARFPWGVEPVVYVVITATTPDGGSRIFRRVWYRAGLVPDVKLALPEPRDNV